MAIFQKDCFYHIIQKDRSASEWIFQYIAENNSLIQTGPFASIDGKGYSTYYDAGSRNWGHLDDIASSRPATQQEIKWLCNLLNGNTNTSVFDNCIEINNSYSIF